MQCGILSLIHVCSFKSDIKALGFFQFFKVILDVPPAFHLLEMTPGTFCMQTSIFVCL